MKIEVINQRIYILDQPETAEGTREYLKAEFSFSKEWTGLTKTAFFCGADGKNYSQLLENDTCNVPAEALAVPGRVEVSVSGTLGESITAEQLEVIRDGSFRDLYVGDYWEINGTKYRIADINYWRNVGYPESEKVQKPHILIVPDTVLGSGQMHTSNSTYGGYRNSEMKSTRLNNIAKTLPDTFKSLLLTHRMFSDGAWINASVDLMSEVMVHGTYICTDNSNKQTSDTQQLALFRLAPELKTIGVNYWLRNVAGSQTYTLISQYGDASSDMATSTYGVRPVFAVG